MAHIFTGNLYAHAPGVYRRPEFLVELAQFYVDLGLSSSQTRDWVIERLYCVHDGDLFDHRERWLDLDNLTPLLLWDRRFLVNSKALKNLAVSRWGKGASWDRIKTLDVCDLLGTDRKVMSNIKGWAKNAPRQPLAEHLVPRIMMLDFARRIHFAALKQASA
ncbi:MAG: hypothetical protein ACPGNV_05180 [Mangrovicoccus sp.]